MKTIHFLVVALCIKGVFGDEVKSVSVKKGESIILHTDTKLQTDDVIEWRFGNKEHLIAKLDTEANTNRIYADVLDGRFRDRLQVNDQTGDLTITNIKTEDSGVYKLVINGEIITTKKFIISVSVDTEELATLEESVIQNNNVTNIKVNDEDQSSGLSSGVVAGLCVFLLVLVFALAVAIFLYRRLSRSTGKNRANEEETGKESAEVKNPLRTESNSSDLS